MEGIERAIRNALEKGNAEDRGFREKVYRSAFAALERTLATKGDITDEMRQRRRAALKAKVFEIETEYVPAMAAAASERASPRPAADVPPPAPRADNPAQGRVEPTLDFAPERRAEPSRGKPTAQRDLAPERDEARVLRARKRSWTGPVLVIVLLVALASVGWWFWQPGSVPTQTGGAPVAAPTTETDQPAATPRPMVSAPDDENWIQLFDPADPTTVTASGDASAAADEQDGDAFVQARSGDSGTPVQFAIGEGALQSIAGSRVVFRISASADEGEGETQISVQCNFAGLGDCGRRRFLVGITRDDFLFEVELSNANPGGAGAISINTDVEGGGRPVRIHSISVAPAR
ncbi:hypothetical protein GRZ55_17460 [Chelativorans sp. ZYF759]|uniref:hypothetical protein n=1 Tax=Chelativorans sp. ZYF759 TaxID=2692213 RepID=UPI00145E5A1C|nr:hypothetical protein [Chelativorans sp. ZYF759]NMG41038.1 hypothetical protein [Chelativorans sp. ZYF759]